MYIIEILPRWHWLVAKGLPPGKRCFYVGETGKEVGDRFWEHRHNRSKVNKAKRPAGAVFKTMIRNNEGRPLKRKVDVALRRTMSERFPPAKRRVGFSDLDRRAAALEEAAVLELRREGHAVYPKNVGKDHMPFESYRADQPAAQ